MHSIFMSIRKGAEEEVINCSADKLNKLPYDWSVEQHLVKEAVVIKSRSCMYLLFIIYF